MQTLVASAHACANPQALHYFKSKVVLSVACDEHETIGIYPADHPEQPFTLMAVLGSSGFLEMTIVGESAQAMLGVRIGEKIVVKW